MIADRARESNHPNRMIGIETLWGSQPRLRFDAHGLDGGDQRGVVDFVVIGGELGEVRQRPVHGIA